MSLNNSSSMCRVPGCQECYPGFSHYCRECGDRDSTHRSRNCTNKKKAGDSNSSLLCRVPGCQECKPGRRHYCSECGDRDSVHRVRDCPKKYKDGLSGIVYIQQVKNNSKCLVS